MESLNSLAKELQLIIGSAENLNKFIGLMTDAIEVNVAEMTKVVENVEQPDRKLSYLVGTQEAYRNLRRGALRALDLMSGKPPQNGSNESVKVNIV